MYFEVAKICGKTKSICKIVRKVKEIHARFAVTTQTAKVMGTVHDKCLIKMEKISGRHEQKCVLFDGNVLHQKASNLM